jgi:hypothetical protein
VTGKAPTVRSARWQRLQQIIGLAQVPWGRSGSYGVLVKHPHGTNAGYLELRVSTSRDGFVRARSIGPWPSPLEPGRVQWAVTISEADVTTYAVEYARTGGRPGVDNA